MHIIKRKAEPAFYRYYRQQSIKHPAQKYRSFVLKLPNN